MTETLLSRGGRAMCALELPPHTPEEAWWQGIIPTAVQVLARRPVYEIASDTYWGGHGLCSVPKPAEGSSHCWSNLRVGAPTRSEIMCSERRSKTFAHPGTRAVIFVSNS